MDDISYANGHPYQNFDVSKLLKASRKNGVKFNVIVNNCKGGINSCDIPFTEDIAKFIDSYKTFTRTAALECKSSFLEDYMIVGTSAMVQDHAPDLLPVSSRPDGRRTWCHVSGAAAEGNKKLLLYSTS